MIEFDPEKRYTIEQTLNHKWFGGIPQMTPEQLKQYEEEIKLKKKKMKVLIRYILKLI